MRIASHHTADIIATPAIGMIVKAMLTVIAIGSSIFPELVPKKII